MKMTDYPERINISPVFRQKREDDFYLVDRAAFPDKGTEYVRADLHAALEAQLAEAKGLLAECAADLASYVDHDYPEPSRSSYPSMKRRYERDMELVYRVRAALAKLEQNENGESE